MRDHTGTRPDRDRRLGVIGKSLTVVAWNVERRTAARYNPKNPL